MMFQLLKITVLVLVSLLHKNEKYEYGSFIEKNHSTRVKV